MGRVCIDVGNWFLTEGVDNSGRVWITEGCWFTREGVDHLRLLVHKGGHGSLKVAGLYGRAWIA
jgi:hypothetical protein